MRRVFFDSWGWIAIAHDNDSAHAKVVSFYKTFLLNKGLPVTTDYVLAETVTLLRTRTAPYGVDVFMDSILPAVKTGKILLERIDEKRWEKAWASSKKHHDRPSISFFDFASFVVMKELNISEVLTADKHFEEVGLGFKKLF